MPPNRIYYSPLAAPNATLRCRLFASIGIYALCILIGSSGRESVANKLKSHYLITCAEAACVFALATIKLPISRDRQKLTKKPNDDKGAKLAAVRIWYAERARLQILASKLDRA